MKYNSGLEKSDKWIVACATVCAIVLFSWLIYDIAFLNPNLAGQTPIGKIYEAQNKVKRKFNRSMIWYAAGQDEIVYEDDWIFTGYQSIAKIRLDSGSEIIVEPDSLIILSRKNGLLQLNLQHGRLLANVKDKDIQINVVRDGKMQSVIPDPESDVLSIAQKTPAQLEAEREALANQEPPLSDEEIARIQQELADIEYLNLDKNGDGELDISLSDLANQRNYKGPEGFTALEDNSLSFPEFTHQKAQLFAGDNTILKLDWADPYAKWDSYDIEVSTDPNFENLVSEATEIDSEHSMKVTQSQDLYWRVKGLNSKTGESSAWSATRIARVEIAQLEKGEPIKLARKKIWHNIPEEKLNNVREDDSYDMDADDAVTLSWDSVEDAATYRVEVSDTEDFSNIREQKIVTGNTLDLANLKLGKNYYRVIPENKNGIAMAKASTGTVGAYLPAPPENSLKTIDNDDHQLLKWAPVKHAKMYQVTYKTDKYSDEKIVKYVEANNLKIPTQTGFLQWHVRAVDPSTKKWVGQKSKEVDWYDAAKRLASLHNTQAAGVKYPKILKPAPKKTFMSVNGSPLFIVLQWQYAKKAKAFEVEVSEKADMSRLVYAKKVNHQSRAVMNQVMKPGVYFMRVRALMDDVTQEAWSEVEAFRVIDRKVRETSSEPSR